MSGAADTLVWYAAFGSNLSSARLACYVRGGVPRGTAREYEGCRDPTPPREHRAITLPGRVRFAGESSVWGGGTAFYAPGTHGAVHARAYLVRLEQLIDIVAQETRHPVGLPLVLAETGPTFHGLSQVYDVVLDLGTLDGHRLLTLSSSRDHRVNPPSEAYVRTFLVGLAEGFDLDATSRISYLAQLDGMSPAWTEDRLHGLL
ncbi:hypothetical protein SAMN05192575_101154 [Nocardioides alpinus]|uniref:Histone deacetylase n=1 Tax=Nocardioides alpinus TaxID=748909 RepID=A0A1I0VEM8_9ACTN|nr:hypothetical protein [Nocardioides alpinus]PKH37219.1 histone deacetylase [Nocardioides alpinus]SFA74507.1 hypothetical protein SAMN05192575_101154 [Nocardioides alpinus]